MQNLPPEKNHDKKLSFALGILLVLTLALFTAFTAFTAYTLHDDPAPLPPAPITCTVVGNIVKCNTTDVAIAAKYCPGTFIVANTYQLRNDNSRTTFICARKGERDYND